MKNISVIVPVYNAEAYLTQCLQSIAEQSHQALQIIVVDDGSTDGSLRIAEDFAAHDKRFVVLSQPNSGQAAARNKAMEYATGDFVAFVDADDCLQTDYLCTLHAAAEGNDIVQCGYQRIMDNGTIAETKLPRHKYQFTVPWGKLYRRSVLQDLRFPEGMIYEDVIFSLRIWAKRPKCTIIPYIGYNYRLNPASTTSRIDRPAQSKLFATIRTTQAPLWLKLYTLIRLKIHFRKHK